MPTVPTAIQQPNKQVPPVVFWCTIKPAMKINRHIVIHCLLALSLFVLPLQSAWAMTSMASFGMDMGSHEMSNMDMDGGPHDMRNMSSAVDMDAAGSDCDENHCNKCFHVASFILTTVAFTDVTPSKGGFSSFFVPLDSPPPIFS